MRKVILLFSPLMLCGLFLSNIALGQNDNSSPGLINLQSAEAVYEKGPQMNGNRMWHHALMMPNGDVALIGGIKEGFVSLNSAEIFNVSDNSFTSLNMVYTHASPAIAKLLDGRYLIAGGSSNYGVPSYKESELFNPADSSFTSAGDMVRFRANGGSAALGDGRVLIAGAWWTHNDAHTVGELFDNSSQTFSSTGLFKISRARAAVVPTLDGGALILGGVRPRGDQENLPVEYYDPETGSISVLQPFMIDESENWTVNADQTITAYQQLNNGSYLWNAYSTSGPFVSYKLVTVDPQTKLVEEFITEPALPGSDSLRVFGQPVIDKQNSCAYLLAVLSESDNYAITVITVDLANKSLTFADNYYEPETYRLNSVPLVLLKDGRIFATGGSVSDNFNAVNNTLFITPPKSKTTAIDPEGDLPEAFSLQQNYPNPFNPETVIGYNLPEADHILLEVFNMTGQKVATLIDNFQSQGYHTVNLNANNLASVIFIYWLRSGNLKKKKKMVLVK